MINLKLTGLCHGLGNNQVDNQLSASTARRRSKKQTTFLSFFVFLSFTFFHSVVIFVVFFFLFFSFHNEGRCGGLDAAWVRVLTGSLCCVLGHNNSRS